MKVHNNSQYMKSQSLNCPKCQSSQDFNQLLAYSLSKLSPRIDQQIYKYLVCPIDRSRIQMRKYKIQSFHTNTSILQRILQAQYNARQVANSFPKDQQTCINISKCTSIIHQNKNFQPQSRAQKQFTFSFTILQKQITPALSKLSANSPLISSTYATSPPSICQLTSQSFQICLLHSKRADLICIEDKKLICSDCGLFGNHKHHELITYNKFRECFSEMTEECFQTFKQLQQRQQKLSSHFIQQQINKRLLQKKQQQLLKIKKFIRFYSDLLRATEKQLTFNLQLSFNQKKQKLMQSNYSTQLQTKIYDYFTSVQRMSEGLSEVFNYHNFEQYVSFLDNKTKDSQILKTGLYLLVEIDNFEKLKSERLQKEIEDLHYSFNNISNLFQQTYTLESKEISHSSTIIEQSKQQTSKLVKMGTPSKNTAVFIQPSKDKGSPLQNLEQQNLLSPQKSNEYQSPFLKPSPSLQSLNFSRIQSRVTQTQLNNVSQFSTSRILTLPKSTQIISKNASSQKLMVIQLENNSQDILSKNSKQKSNAKNTYQNEFFNILGQKNTDPKKRKKLQLPQKLVKVYQDLVKDKLEVLDLGKGYLGNLNVLLISELFPSRSHLKVVKLMNNRITDDIFIDLLSKCKGLTSLNLGGNQLSEKSLEWLQREAKNLGQLKNITLSCNKIVLRNVKERLQALKERGLNVSL